MSFSISRQTRFYNYRWNLPFTLAEMTSTLTWSTASSHTLTRSHIAVRFRWEPTRSTSHSLSIFRSLIFQCYRPCLLLQVRLYPVVLHRRMADFIFQWALPHGLRIEAQGSPLLSMPTNLPMHGGKVARSRCPRLRGRQAPLPHGDQHQPQRHTQSQASHVRIAPTLHRGLTADVP